MVANPKDLIYYRFTPADAALLPLLDGEHSIGEIVVARLNDNDELDLAGVIELVGLLEAGGFLDSLFVDVVLPWSGRCILRRSGPGSPVSRRR